MQEPFLETPYTCSKELFMYASQYLQNEVTCRDVQQWLNIHLYTLNDFFITLTAMQYGKLDNLESVATAFKANWLKELEKEYPRFLFGNSRASSSFISEETTQPFNIPKN